jgi:hypothetical protein
MSESPFPFMDVSSSPVYRRRTGIMPWLRANTPPTGIHGRHKQQSRHCCDVEHPSHSQRLHIPQCTGRCIPSGLVAG